MNNKQIFGVILADAFLMVVISVFVFWLMLMFVDAGERQTCYRVTGQIKEHLEQGLYPTFYVTKAERAACDSAGTPIENF